MKRTAAGAVSMTKTHQATIAGAAVLAAALIGGCAGRPAPAPAPSQPYPPPACDRTAIEHADALKLPATRPDDQQAFARRLAVDRKLSRLGRWQQAQGWSTLVVQMHSAGATSLSSSSGSSRGGASRQRIRSLPSSSS